MAQIQFFNGVTLANRPAAKVVQVIRLDTLAAALKEMRADWQTAAGDDLAAVNASVGLMLADFVNLCGFDPETARDILGGA